MFVQQVEGTVNRVVIGQGDVAHPSLFCDLVDVFRRVVAVSGVSPAEILEDRKAAMTVQIGAFERRIGHHDRRSRRAHWIRMIVQPTGIFYNLYADVVESGHKSVLRTIGSTHSKDPDDKLP